MIADIVWLESRVAMSAAQIVEDDLRRYVSPETLAQACARARRLEACGIRRDAIVRRVVAWALYSAPKPEDAA